MRPWQDYAIHNHTCIKGFFGPFRFLSNFGECSGGVWYGRFWYKTSETAFQAQKIESQFREEFGKLGAGSAKREWLNYPKAYTGEEWDKIKLNIMAGIVFAKFEQNLDLRQQLLDTGDRYLEETNDWNDVYWGVVPGIGGKNKLGIILTLVRNYWKGLAPTLPKDV